MTNTLFSFGHGYSAQALSRRLMPEGWRVVGTTRDAEGTDAIRASGAEPLIWPGKVPDLDGVSVTVSEVRTSPDLKVATAFVLPLGGVQAEVVLAALRRARGELRRQINRHVDLKFSPELRFVLDESFDRMDETRVLLSEDRVRMDVDQDQD